MYHYDPQNPPPSFTVTSTRPPSSPQKVSPQEKFTKERALSPKKQRSRSSPSLNKRSNLINSSTSPSLPFTPPLQHNRGMQYSSSSESMPNLSVQQYHPAYGSSYNSIPTQENSVQVYQQPYIVYASYGVPVPTQFEGRMVSLERSSVSVNRICIKIFFSILGSTNSRSTYRLLHYR